MNMNINEAPMISVIMGIYNCEKTLPLSIESVLNQTYQNFELILCDDGSTDGTYEVAEKYKNSNPEKIILIKNDSNKGLNYTLNHCLEYARGKYIARMDGDDASLPERFETEVKYLESHPEITILGASLRVFDENGVWGIHVFKEFPEAKDFVKGTQFSHSVCMVRKEAYDAVCGYSVDDKLLRVEDFHLWVKMYSKGYKGANLKEELYMYRDDRDGVMKRKFKFRINESYVICLAVKMLKLPVYNYVYALRPILVGVLPLHLYELLHKKKMNRR